VALRSRILSSVPANAVHGRSSRVAIALAVSEFNVLLLPKTSERWRVIIVRLSDRFSSYPVNPAYSGASEYVVFHATSLSGEGTFADQERLQQPSNQVEKRKKKMVATQYASLS
jgi:hypothetical protein